MSEPEGSPAAGEPLDCDGGEIDERSYLRFVEETLCEWLSAADAEAYDGLWDDQDPAGPTPSSRA